MTERPDPKIVIVGRRRGRPPATEPHGTAVVTWVSADLAEALYKSARAREIAVSALVRDILQAKLSNNRLP